MEKRVLNYIEKNNMLEHGDGVVLGVSGGADSVCLLIMLNKISTIMDLKLTVVHVNHHLRGKEADDDQHFVENLCRNLNLPCQVFHIDMKKLAGEMNCSEEEAGRIARYNIFNEVAKKCKAGHIAVAHNLNDNVETMIFNMVRGTGIKGAAGISPVRDNIIRPILCLTRKEIEEYLSSKEIDYRTDSTNLTDEYSRNKIRNQVIPYLEKNINTATVQNMAGISEELSEINEILNDKTDELFDKYVMSTESESGHNKLIIDEKISGQRNLFVQRVIRKALYNVAGRLKDITRQHTDSVIALFANNTGSQVDLPYNITAYRTYTGVELLEKCKEQPDTGTKLTDSQWEEILFEDGEISHNEKITLNLLSNWSKLDVEQDLVCTKVIDCDRIKDKLVVRNRRPGDYIRLDGADNGDVSKNYITKKLKQYFIDKKVPQKERDKVLLVADGSEIVWIVGHRLSAAYKVTDKTRKILKLEATV